MSWRAELIKHRGALRIAVYFDKNPEFIRRIQLLANARWSVTQQVWHLPDTDENRERFKLPPRFQANKMHQEKMAAFVQWLISKRYSESTIKTYREALNTFLAFYNDKELEAMEVQDIIRFNNEYIVVRQLSESYQNQMVNALKLFFKHIMNNVMDVELIHRPRPPKLLPNVLSKEEVKRILDAHDNMKHRTMLSLIYSCGLRRSELLHLKPRDIDSQRGIIIIRQAKGKKDRIVPLSTKILEMLRVYFVAYRPKEYLFEGQESGKPYDERSLQQVMKHALIKAGIKKPATLHWLRHSYATHLLEVGTDLRYIQELLGHKSSRTTEIYTHVSTREIQKIKSPFDDL
jgi:integrase/recombinase XerD